MTTRMRHRRKRKSHGHGRQFFPPASPYQGIARHARRRNTSADPTKSGHDAREQDAAQPPTTPQEPPEEEAANEREATP